MNAQIIDNKLVITIELRKERTLSKSGKNITVASTCGNKTTEAKIDGKNIVVGLNAYYEAN